MVKKIVKKKVVKKSAPKKKVVVKKVSKAETSMSRREVHVGEKRSLRGMIFFGVLFIVCTFLFTMVDTVMYQTLFFLFALGFGSVALAFLISFLVFYFYSVIRIKKV